MDILNFEDKGDSVGKADVKQEEEENGTDAKNGDEEVQEEGAGMISPARMFLIGRSDVSGSLLHHSDESVAQKQQKTGSCPHIGYFGSLQREVYYYADERIIIEEGLDSYAGMIWPAVSSVLVQPSSYWRLHDAPT